MSATDEQNSSKKAKLDAVQQIPDEEPAYVVVKDSENGEPMELPCREDKTLSLATLAHSFPGATGLKFKNPKTGASRALLLDASGQHFVSPAGGWEDKVFLAIFPPVAKVESVSAGKGDAKRRKVVSSDDEDEDERGDGSGEKKRERLARTQDLLILGLPYEIDDSTIRDYLETFGPVKMLNVKRNPDGKTKGYAFCIYEKLEDQEKVLYQSHTIGGRLCEIKLPIPAYAPNARGIPMSRTPKSTESFTKKVFLGRLTDKLTSERLRDFFTQEVEAIDPKASVCDIYIPKPFRGFGFLTVSSSDVAKKLVKMGSIVVDDVSVALSIALPRDDELNNDRGSNSGGSGVRNEYAAAGMPSAPYGFPMGTFPAPFPTGYLNPGAMMVLAGGMGMPGGGYGGLGGRRDMHRERDRDEGNGGSSPYYNKHKRPMRGDGPGPGAGPVGGDYGYPPQQNPGNWVIPQGSHNIVSGVDAINLNQQQSEYLRWYQQSAGMMGPGPSSSPGPGSGPGGRKSHHY